MATIKDLASRRKLNTDDADVDTAKQGKIRGQLISGLDEDVRTALDDVQIKGLEHRFLF